MWKKFTIRPTKTSKMEKTILGVVQNLQSEAELCIRWDVSDAHRPIMIHTQHSLQVWSDNSSPLAFYASKTAKMSFALFSVDFSEILQHL